MSSFREMRLNMSSVKWRPFCLGLIVLTQEWSQQNCEHETFWYRISPDSKVHRAYMGRTWVLSAPGGPHVGLMNLGIWETFEAWGYQLTTPLLRLCIDCRFHKLRPEQNKHLERLVQKIYIRMPNILPTTVHNPLPTLKMFNEAPNATILSFWHAMTFPCQIQVKGSNYRQSNCSNADYFEWVDDLGLSGADKIMKYKSSHSSESPHCTAKQF